jgi:hypothetical protein
MATAATTPQPLNSDEIREGISVRIAQAIAELDDPIRELVKQAIFLSLGKTCSLNGTAFSKFSATWKFRHAVVKGQLQAKWWVDYVLDDFGRLTVGGIGGNIGDPGEDAEIAEGLIQEMPPDRFRRETKQPIPAPQVVKAPEPNQIGMSKAWKGQGKRREV